MLCPIFFLNSHYTFQRVLYDWLKEKHRPGLCTVYWHWVKVDGSILAPERQWWGRTFLGTKLWAVHLIVHFKWKARWPIFSLGVIWLRDAICHSPECPCSVLYAKNVRPWPYLPRPSSLKAVFARSCLERWGTISWGREQAQYKRCELPKASVPRLWCKLALGTYCLCMGPVGLAELENPCKCCWCSYCSLCCWHPGNQNRWTC